MSYYPVFPRSLNTAGNCALLRSWGIERTRNSRYGMRSQRMLRNKPIKIVDLSWQDVPAYQLHALEEFLIDNDGGGTIIAPTFQGDKPTRLRQYQSGAKTTGVLSGSNITVDDVTPFSNWSVVISSGVNDKLDFKYKDSGGTIQTSSITLTANTYTGATGGNLAAEITIKINTAIGGSPNPEVQCDYSGVIGADFDDRFHIYEVQNGDAQQYLELLWHSGANAATSVGSTLGFDNTRDQVGKYEYKSHFFKAPFGNRAIIYNPADTNNTNNPKGVYITAIDTGTKTLTINYEGSFGTKPIGSTIEPVFNAEIWLNRDDELGSVFSLSTSKGRAGIVSGSIRLVEVFNA